MTLNKSTLSEQIYQILRSDILNQKIPLGEKLTLQRLKEQFEVSSTPIREALTRLTEDGLVCYYSNIGVRVLSPTADDLKELYQFMGDLDRIAILYSAQAVQNSEKRSEILRKLQEVISVTQMIEEKEVLFPEDIAHWIEASDRFHLIFYDYCDNSRLKHAAEKQRSQLTIFSNMYEKEMAAQRVINSMHTRIYEAYQKEDYEKAGELMKLHLEDSMRYALQQLEKST